jgi:hypothetical protein
VSITLSSQPLAYGLGIRQSLYCYSHTFVNECLCVSNACWDFSWVHVLHFLACPMCLGLSKLPCKLEAHSWWAIWRIYVLKFQMNKLCFLTLCELGRDCKVIVLCVCEYEFVLYYYYLNMSMPLFVFPLWLYILVLVKLYVWCFDCINIWICILKF